MTYTKFFGVNFEEMLKDTIEINKILNSIDRGYLQVERILCYDKQQ